jgi:hypothetical protein
LTSALDFRLLQSDNCTFLLLGMAGAGVEEVPLHGKPTLKMAPSGKSLASKPLAAWCNLQAAREFLFHVAVLGATPSRFHFGRTAAWRHH